MRLFCNLNGYECTAWGVACGLFDLNHGDRIGHETVDTEEALNYILNKSTISDLKDKGVKGIVYVMSDVHKEICPQKPKILSTLRAISMSNSLLSLIIIGDDYNEVPCVKHLSSIIDFPLSHSVSVGQRAEEILRILKAQSKGKILNDIDIKSLIEKSADLLLGLPMNNIDSIFLELLLKHLLGKMSIMKNLKTHFF